MAKGKAPMAADEGYCVKCKAKRKISNAQQVKMANGRPALKGVCPVCGTGMFKILPPKEACPGNRRCEPPAEHGRGLFARVHPGLAPGVSQTSAPLAGYRPP